MKEGKLACTSFPPRWNDVIRYALVLVLEGKLAYWDDVVRDVLVLVLV
jgi:hypothetical protein